MVEAVVDAKMRNDFKVQSRNLVTCEMLARDVNSRDWRCFEAAIKNKGVWIITIEVALRKGGQ
jgi:hypothetical protein